MPGYPIELDLRGRSVLVVGLGTVGFRKASGLLAAGARVIGVDPAPTAEALSAGLDLRAEPYQTAHLQGVCLAFAAGPPDVNERVVAEARSAGLWVNSASDPGSGDLTIPAVWRSGGLTLTVSTSGASPALALALRDRAAAAIGPEAGGLIALLAEVRPIVLAKLVDPSTRRRVLAAWADPRWLDLYRAEGADAVRAELLRAIDGEVP